MTTPSDWEREFDSQFTDPAFWNKSKRVLKGGSIHLLEKLKSFIHSTREEAKREVVEQIIGEIFGLRMHDSFGYGNRTVYVHDLEKWAAKYGYDEEKIIKLLPALTSTEGDK